jgi:hypothetical protein
LFNTGKVKYHIKHSNAIERVHSDNKTKNQAKKKKINSRGRRSYTATGLADDESNAILLNFIDDFLPHRHDRKMRETGLQ